MRPRLRLPLFSRPYPAPVPASHPASRRISVLHIVIGAALLLLVFGAGAVRPADAQADCSGLIGGGSDLCVTTRHLGFSGPGSDFYTSTTTGVVEVTVTNRGNAPTTVPPVLNVNLGGGLVINAVPLNPDGYLPCIVVPPSSNFNCTAGAVFAVNQPSTITFSVTTPAMTVLNASNVVRVYPDDSAVFGDLVNNNNTASDAFNVLPPPSDTPTATATIPPLPTLSLVPTLTPIPPTLTRTFIPPLPTRTPLPRPANAGQAIPIPPSGVSVVTNRDGVNVRITPAIGAAVIAFVNAGTLFENVSGRSGDGEWVRVQIAGQEGWVGFPVITVLTGDTNALPVADPRTIPYGGFEQPRAGESAVGGPITGRLALSGIRVRSGPGIGYVVLANAPRYTVFPLLGRTANNTWVQVNFEGTLGWVAGEYIEFQQGLGVLEQLPIDGIIADGLPVSNSGADGYNDTLSIFRARVDIALQSLNQTRDRWTRVSLGEAIQCGDYPARPSDFNIPNPLLAAFNGTLNPIQRDFNRAMSLIRQGIDALIDSCQTNQPPQGLIGAGAVSLALNALNEADGLLNGLIPQLDALIPDNSIPTEDQCLFTFNQQNQIVDRLLSGRAVLVQMDDDNYVIGFCFDGTQGETYRLEGLILPEANTRVRINVSPFNDPTSFIAAGELRAGQGNATGGAGYSVINNILIPQTGQYLVILSDLNFDDQRVRPLVGDFALLLLNTTGAVGELALGLAYNPVSGEIVVNPNIDIVIQAPPIGAPGSPSVLGDGSIPNAMTPGTVPTATRAFAQ